MTFLSCSLHVTCSFVVCLRFGCDSPGWKLKPTVPYQEVGTGADWHPGVWSGGWCQIHPPEGAALCSSRWNYSPVSPFFQDRGIFCWHTHKRAETQNVRTSGMHQSFPPAPGEPETPHGERKLGVSLCEPVAFWRFGKEERRPALLWSKFRKKKKKEADEKTNSTPKIPPHPPAPQPDLSDDFPPGPGAASPLSPRGSGGLRCGPPPRPHRRISPPARPPPAPAPLAACPSQRGCSRRAPRGPSPAAPRHGTPRPPLTGAGGATAGVAAPPPPPAPGPSARETARCEAAAPPLTAAAAGPSSGRGAARRTFRRGPRSNGGAGRGARRRCSLGGVTLGGRSAWAVTQPPPDWGQLWSGGSSSGSSTKGPRGDEAGGSPQPATGAAAAGGGGGGGGGRDGTHRPSRSSPGGAVRYGGRRPAVPCAIGCWGGQPPCPSRQPLVPEVAAAPAPPQGHRGGPISPTGKPRYLGRGNGA